MHEFVREQGNIKVTLEPARDLRWYRDLFYPSPFLLNPLQLDNAGNLVPAFQPSIECNNPQLHSPSRVELLTVPHFRFTDLLSPSPLPHFPCAVPRLHRNFRSSTHSRFSHSRRVFICTFSRDARISWISSDNDSSSCIHSPISGPTLLQQSQTVDSYIVWMSLARSLALTVARWTSRGFPAIPARTPQRQGRRWRADAGWEMKQGLRWSEGDPTKIYQVHCKRVSVDADSQRQSQPPSLPSWSVLVCIRVERWV